MEGGKVNFRCILRHDMWLRLSCQLSVHLAKTNNTEYDSAAIKKTDYNEMVEILL